MLNGQQFRQFVNNVKGGGDTVHVRSGERPSVGTMVSIPGREVRHDTGSFGLPEATQYAAHHLRELSDPDQYMGGWAHEGQAYLDVSRRYPTAEEAVTKGWQWNQKAVFRLDDAKEITVPDSPRDLPIWRNNRRLPH